MNRRTFIKGSITLSVVGIVGCTETEVKDKSENDAIEKVNTDTVDSFTDEYTRITVVFKEVESGTLQLIAYDNGEIINSKTITVISQKVATHKFSEYYTDIDVKFERQ